MLKGRSRNQPVIIVVLPALILFSTMLSSSILSPAAADGIMPDRFVSDAVYFLAEDAGGPVRLVLNFSRGTSDIEGHQYAAECTGHLLRDGMWDHLGPGSYECPETTLAVIPNGPNFSVSRAADPPVFTVTFTSRSHKFRLEIERMDSLFDMSQNPEYRARYAAGPASLLIGSDTIPGRALHRQHDFTGYNRLARNTRGYFPGRHDFAVLSGTAGEWFIFSTDPVQQRDADGRVNANFAAATLPGGLGEVVTDSVYTQWAEVDDTLHAGKPVPQVWKTFVAKRKWKANYRDVSHFFYFTGFGLFAVEGTVEFADSTYQVTGIVEHIHARDTPR